MGYTIKLLHIIFIPIGILDVLNQNCSRILGKAALNYPELNVVRLERNYKGNWIVSECNEDSIN
jgi:hypothetical protein